MTEIAHSRRTVKTLGDFREVTKDLPDDLPMSMNPWDTDDLEITTYIDAADGQPTSIAIDSY